VLSHEKLVVYQKSIEFLAFAVKLIEAMPRGHGGLADQLKRASLSVPLNIAEASGRTGSADNARRFAIARGSALECGAILDACRVLGLGEHRELTQGKAVLTSVVAMLSILSRSRRPGEDQG
jgi:four helix bundle protein